VFVQTTVDRGPDSDTNPTKVSHFISKFNIEKHLIRRTSEEGSKMTFTILRPTVFMENFGGGFMTKLMATAMRDSLPADLEVQMVAANDIGWFGAQALTRPEDARYQNQSISLAGDCLTYEEIQRIHQEVCGTSVPTTYSAVTWAVSVLVKELPMTLQSFVEDGFSADVQELWRVNPGLKTFRKWLEARKPS